MSNEQTPGPWVVAEDAGLAVVTLAEDVAVQDIVVATLPRVNHANTRLIAAAPRMLAALERVGCQDVGSCPDPHDGKCFVCDAIARATGGDR